MDGSTDGTYLRVRADPLAHNDVIWVGTLFAPAAFHEFLQPEHRGQDHVSSHRTERLLNSKKGGR